MKRYVCVSLLFVPLYGVGQAFAEKASETMTSQAESSGAEPARFLDFRNNDRLTGDWGGLRTDWEEKGIEFGLSATHVYQHNARGGLQTHNGHRITGSVDYELILDFEALGLWSGGVLYVAGESSWVDGIDEDRVGNMFGVNGDAGGDESILVPELWYEHTFWDGKARLRIGKMDLGADFETNAYANDETAQFLNPALIGAANVPMPDLGIGARASAHR